MAIEKRQQEKAELGFYATSDLGEVEEKEGLHIYQIAAKVLAPLGNDGVIGSYFFIVK